MTLPPLFSGEVPERDIWIGNHRVPFSPRHWLDRLPERWMFAELAYLEPADTARWPMITRRFLFDLASEVDTPEMAVRFYVSVCAWGAGTKAMLVGRRVRVLRENKDPGEHLLAAIRLARQDGAAAAYAAMRHGGEHRLVHLGPGFFTKILYFGAYDTASGLKPLILDQYVAAALQEQAGLGWQSGWSWTTAQYEHYLALAGEWADAWGTTPDVVERMLFEHGKRLP